MNRASLPQALVSPLAYEFFTMDPTSGKVREFDRIFGPDAERDFWLRLDDLAHDLSELLAGMANHGPTSL